MEEDIDIATILETIQQIKKEKIQLLQKVRELNKTIFEYEMRFFLLSKKKRMSQEQEKVLEKIEKKIRQKLTA